MPFKPGNVANPTGRPVGQRSIADALRREGQRKVKHKGHWVSQVDVMASMVYSAVTTGQAVLVGDKTLTLNPKLWVDLVKFVSVHVDGPAKAELDITTGGQPLKTYIGFTPDQWDDVIDADIVDDTKALPSGE